MKYLKRALPEKIVIIPNHNTVAKGTLKSILEQADIKLNDFLQK